MERKEALQKNLEKAVFCVLGFVSCMVAVMGYYPLFPSVYALYCLQKRRISFFYVACIMGMCYFMPFATAIKYILVLIIIRLGIRFYQWANRNCSSRMAGIIAGISAFAMNMSGTGFSATPMREIALNISEGVLIVGITPLLYYAMERIFANEWKAKIKWKQDDYPGTEVISPEETEGKIAAFTSAVDGLANAFVTMSRPKEKDTYEELGVLEQEIFGKLCINCEGCAICWDENQISYTGKIRTMLRAVMEHWSKEQIVEAEFVTDCPMYPGMVEEAIAAFSRMELNQAWYKRLLQNRMVIAQQLDAMANLMENWTKEPRNVDSAMKHVLNKIVFEAKEKGIQVEDIHIFEDEAHRKYVKAYVSGKWSGGIPSKYYLKILERSLGVPMRLQRESKGILTREPYYIIAYEDTVFYTLPGIATHKKAGSIVSGDNFSMFDQEDGHHYVCISDGMGSGSRANQESELVVDLLEKFIDAGFEKESAIMLMNSAMVLQGEDNAYSTFDLADFNLYTGEVELIKIGAAATFIKHCDKVEHIISTTLPTGVDYSLEVEKVSKTLGNGDFLVMVTDGVLEYLQVRNPEETLAQIIAQVKTENAGTLAKGILERVLLFTGGNVMDDMTILVTGVWEK